MSSCLALQSYLNRIQDVRFEIEGNAASPAILRATAGFLGRIQNRLARPPRIAIIGESNTGKTSLTNLLLGQDLLVADIINNTRAPILIRHAAYAQLSAIELDGTRRALTQDNVGALDAGTLTHLELGLPVAALRVFEIIDTPGASALAGDQDRLSFVCRQADMAIWCTLATQAWRATERDLWDAVNDRMRSSSLLAVTHADALTQQEQARVMERLRREAAPSFFDVGMLSVADQGLGAGMPSGAGAGRNDLWLDFRVKLDAALVQVEERRLNGARRAVHRFEQRLDRPAPNTFPVEHLRAAS
jgi:50S ribosome-binding GTPase